MATLKDFLQSVGESGAGKKAELVEKVQQYFANK